MSEPYYENLNGIDYCNVDCPHLDHDNDECKKINKGLIYNDWFIARCNGQYINEDGSEFDDDIK